MEPYNIVPFRYLHLIPSPNWIPPDELYKWPVLLAIVESDPRHRGLLLGHIVLVELFFDCETSLDDPGFGEIVSDVLGCTLTDQVGE